VRNLDWTTEIGWYGQSAETFAEFRQQERARYVQLGLEFPRPEVDENYYHRVNPIPARAFELEEDAAGEGIVVLSRNGSEVYDRVIYAPGFTDMTDQVLSTARPNVYANLGELNSFVPVRQPGARITGSFGEIVVDKALPGTAETGFLEQVEIVRTYPKGRQEVSTMSEDNYYQLLDSLAGQVTQVETPNTPDKELVYADYTPPPRVIRDRQEMSSEFDMLWNTRGAVFRDAAGSPVTASREDMALAMQSGRIACVEIPANRTAAMESIGNEPIARKIFGTEIYLAGPAAKLELSDAERASTPALAQIPANTASGFRYVARVEQLAGYLAGRDRTTQALPKPGCILELGQPYAQPEAGLRASGSSSRCLTVFSSTSETSVQAIVVGRALEVDAKGLATVPPGSAWEDLVRLTVAEAEEVNVISPDGAERELIVDWVRAPRAKARWVARVRGVPASERRELADLVGDALLTRMAEQHIAQAGERGSAELRVPISNGVVDLSRVAMRSVRAPIAKPVAQPKPAQLKQPAQPKQKTGASPMEMA
jgi:hypothetical protein